MLIFKDNGKFDIGFKTLQPDCVSNNEIQVQVYRALLSTKFISFFYILFCCFRKIANALLSLNLASSNQVLNQFILVVIRNQVLAQY